jgi:putative spermidine/putrescine transport system ATP-binding protein
LSDTTFTELRLAEVGRSYGRSPALTDLSLTVKNGEFVALLGPSGCGKSTALNCVAGLLPLSHGTISLDDRRVDTLAPEKRGFGMVFQNYALFPHMSVRKNIAFGLHMSKVPRDEVTERVDDALRLVQLKGQAEKRPAQLSGGQQQRVAIARAVVMRPQVVLMDEPLSNLDAKLRHEMRGEIQRLHRELGLTTVYVTHDQEEALSLADRMVVLRDGKVQQIGAPAEVFTKPVNSFVADFMGYRNLLEMTVTGPRPGSAHAVITGHGMSLPVLPGAAAGSALVAIRPDDWSLGETGDNGVELVVTRVEYLGRDFEVDATTKDGTTVYLRTNHRVAVEQRISASVRPERIMVYPGERDAEALVGSASDALSLA